MIDNTIREKCSGCNMCGDICPVGAITYKTDEEGFWYPYVDSDKCIKCGKCINACPCVSDSTKLKKHTPTVYAGWTNDDEIRLKSTSGGIFYELANYVLSVDGVIVGSVYSDDYKSAYHFIGQDQDDLLKIMGSKYFQSNLEGIYKKIKDLLKENKTVLFCGTPCQGAALQKFLGENNVYENLYIIDFICLGINSPLAFRSFVEEQEKKYGSKAIKVQLKNKRKGWESLASYIQFENGREYHKTVDNCPWVNGYIMDGGLFIRRSCYECQFRTIPRLSDITIGDFWDIEDVSSDDKFKGISTILVNSSKGEILLDNIKNKLSLIKKTYEELRPGNPALESSPIPNENRDRFFDDLKSYGFEESVNKTRKKNASKPNAIINYWFCDVHGAILTAYALQKLLKDYNIDSDLIAVQDLNQSDDSISGNFVEKYMSVNPKIYKTPGEIKQLSKQYDSFLVGSDQVFRTEWVPDHWFLDFVSLKTNKVAVSASFGTDTLNCDAFQRRRIAYWLNRFNSVSIREIEGVKLCESISGRSDIKHVLDPVFLVDGVYYDTLIRNANIKRETPFVICYLRDENDTINNCVDDYCKENHVEKVTIDNNLPVEDFLYLFSNCERVFTDSFHGMCFSIIFKKQFICLKNVLRGTSRFDSVEEAFHLPQNIFANNEKEFVAKTIANECIDYEQIEEYWSKRRDEDIMWVINAVINKKGFNRINICKAWIKAVPSFVNKPIDIRIQRIKGFIKKYIKK